MRPNLILLAALSLTPLAAVCSLTGCEEKKPAPTSVATKPSTPAKADDHGHDHGPSGEHADRGHGHAFIALGEQAIGSFMAKASREEGQIVAGKDAAIDVLITPTTGTTAKVAAVRFWIGTQDAKGSVKAKAQIEDPKDPTHWHVHAEIPSPVPAGSKLWVEIEDDKGATSVGGFELKS